MRAGGGARRARGPGAFDDVDVAMMIHPADHDLPTLTTLVQPVEDMGLACAKILIELIESRGKHRQVTFETLLREGGSVQRLNA